MTSPTLLDNLGPLKPRSRRRWVAVIGLAVVGFMIAYFIIVGGADTRAQTALLQRVHELTARNHSPSTMVKVRDLFGNDTDGVCVLLNGFPTDKAVMVRSSPKQFAPIIDELQRMDPESGFGPGGWFVFAIRKGKLAQKYKFNFGEDVEVSSLGGDHACYDGNARVHIGVYQSDDGPGVNLDFYSERAGGEQ